MFQPKDEFLSWNFRQHDDGSAAAEWGATSFGAGAERSSKFHAGFNRRGKDVIQPDVERVAQERAAEERKERVAVERKQRLAELDKVRHTERRRLQQPCVLFSHRRRHRRC